MSPRCSERSTLQNNFQTYEAVCKLSRGLKPVVGLRGPVKNHDFRQKKLYETRDTREKVKKK